MDIHIPIWVLAALGGVAFGVAGVICLAAWALSDFHPFNR